MCYDELVCHTCQIFSTSTLMLRWIQTNGYFGKEDAYGKQLQIKLEPIVGKSCPCQVAIKFETVKISLTKLLFEGASVGRR